MDPGTTRVGLSRTRPGSKDGAHSGRRGAMSLQVVQTGRSRAFNVESGRDGGTCECVVLSASGWNASRHPPKPVHGNLDKVHLQPVPDVEVGAELRIQLLSCVDKSRICSYVEDDCSLREMR